MKRFPASEDPTLWAEARKQPTVLRSGEPTVCRLRCLAVRLKRRVGFNYKIILNLEKLFFKVSKHLQRIF